MALSVSIAVAGCAADPNRSSDAPSDIPEAPPRAGSDDVASVASAPVGCEQEFALECGDGFVDGCLLKHPSEQSKLLTSHHVCVARGEAKGGPPCTQEIARECPEGQQDACLVSPPLSDVHICVAK